MDVRVRTAVHESGHAIVGQAVGLSILRVTVDGSGNSGRCHYEQGHCDTLQALRSRLTMSLAGRIAEMIAERKDWRTLPLHAVRGLEPTDYLGEVTNVLAARGEDHPRLAAYRWLDEATPTAAARAARILQDQWDDVQGLAAQLLVDGEVDLMALPPRP